MNLSVIILDVIDVEPWIFSMTNSSYNLHMKESENSFPFKESSKILIDKVLPRPGLPQIINGILLTTQKKEAKRFSFY